MSEQPQDGGKAKPRITAFDAVRQPDLAMRISGRQGWRQMLTWKRELLNAYDKARQFSSGHEVETFHGLVAEAHFRSWLSEFLPRRFGVTAGYIVSPGLPESERTPAFDVIIYDQINSPVLWAESHPDISPQGTCRAIPVEYVKAVIEVKSAFNSTSVSKAVEHLQDLKNVLGTENPDLPFKCHLPRGFTCWTVFFDLREEDRRSFAALDHLAPACAIRGYSGGVVLRGSGLEDVMTGQFGLGGSNCMNSLESAPDLTAGTCFSKFYDHGGHPLFPGERWYSQVSLSWSKVYFSIWPFHLLKMLNEDYSMQSLPSHYCLPQVGEPFPDEVK